MLSPGKYTSSRKCVRSKKKIVLTCSRPDDMAKLLEEKDDQSKLSQANTPVIGCEKSDADAVLPPFTLNSTTPNPNLFKCYFLLNSFKTDGASLEKAAQASLKRAAVIEKLQVLIMRYYRQSTCFLLVNSFETDGASLKKAAVIEKLQTAPLKWE